MKRFLSICLVVCVACVAYAGSLMDWVTLTDPEAATAAAADATIVEPSSGGLLEGIYIVVTNEREILVSEPNAGAATTPDVDGLYFDVQSTTYNSSNQYVDESGAYKIRYETTGFTNWTLSTVATGLSGPMWTNDAFIATNWHVRGTGATGDVGIAATTTDVDIDVTTYGTPYSPAITLFSADNITSSAYYPIRIPLVNTAGSAAVWTNLTGRIAFGARVQMDAYAATEENVTVKAILFYQK